MTDAEKGIYRRYLGVGFVALGVLSIFLVDSFFEYKRVTGSYTQVPARIVRVETMDNMARKYTVEFQTLDRTIAKSFMSN